jgi:hypothetical protein
MEVIAIMGNIKMLADEWYEALGVIETHLTNAEECLIRGDEIEARKYIDDALAEIVRQKAK